MALPAGWEVVPEPAAAALPKGWALADDVAKAEASPAQPPSEPSLWNRFTASIDDSAPIRALKRAFPPSREMQDAISQRGGPGYDAAREQAFAADAGPLAEDWIAQGIIGGIVGGGAGKLVAPVASKLGPLARFVTGGTEGAVANKVQGGDATTGALIGMGFAVPSVAKAVASSPAVIGKAKALATKDIGRDIISADGPRAKVTDQKRIAEVNDRLFDLTQELPELRSTWRKPAEKALPEIAAAKRAAAEPLDRIYDHVDTGTGGVRLGDIVDGFEEAARNAGKKASGQAEAARFRAVKENFLKAYGEPGFDPNAVINADGMTAGRGIEMLERAKARGANVDDQIARIREQAVGGINLEKRIPTKMFREEVTDLHKNAESAMGGLEGTARHEALAKLYETGKNVIDRHLDASGLPPEELAQLRKANDQYFLLSRAEAAIESRGWKETNRQPGLAHTVNQAVHGGSLAAAAGYGVMHPHAIPAMAAAYGAVKVAPAVASRINWALANQIPGAPAAAPVPASVPTALFRAAEEKRRRDAALAASLSGGMQQ